MVQRLKKIDLWNSWETVLSREHFWYVNGFIDIIHTTNPYIYTLWMVLSVKGKLILTNCLNFFYFNRYICILASIWNIFSTFLGICFSHLYLPPPFFFNHLFTCCWLHVVLYIYNQVINTSLAELLVLYSDGWRLLNHFIFCYCL